MKPGVWWSVASSARRPAVIITVTFPETGLKVTPWHPIRMNNSWCFPGMHAEAREEPCEAVYSFLLEAEDHVSMIINDVECITLAHGIKDDPVAFHPYFGSSLPEMLTRST